MTLKDTERWKKIQSLFEQAIELDSEAVDAFLKQECGGDADLLADLRRLLELHQEENLTLDRRPVALPDLTPLFSTRALTIGQVLHNRFEILDFLGEGGIGEVYLALDRTLNQKLALKTLHPFRAAEESTRERFKREINLARRITHPNVCRIHDFYEDPQSASFLTMEFLEGETLGQALTRRQKLPFDEIRPIVTQVAAALDAAHALGIVHRDLKPSNIMLCDGGGRAVLMDFGLATLVHQHDPSGATLPSSALGTPAYMSPEQLEGRKVTPASDVYALGVVLYELLTGTAPHRGLSPLAIAARRVQEPPPSPRAIEPSTPARWDAAVRRALALAPNERFARAGEFIRALDEGSWRLPRRELSFAAAGLAVTAGLGAAAYRYWPVSRSAGSRWLDLAMRKAALGAYPSALALFEKAAEAEPGSVEARLGLAESLIALDRLERARAEILRADSDAARWWFVPRAVRLRQEAVKALSVRDWKLAAERYREIEGARLAWARAERNAGNLAGARQALEPLLREDPPSAAAWLERGRQARQDKKADESKAAFARAGSILDLEKDLEGLFELALEQGDAARAVQLAGELRSPAAEVRARYAEVAALRQRGQTSQALELAEKTYQMAVDARLEELGLEGLLAQVSALSGQYDEARAEAILLKVIPQAEQIRAGALAARARYLLAVTQSHWPERDHLVEPNLSAAASFYRESQRRAELDQVLSYHVLLPIKQARYSEARKLTEEISTREADEHLAHIDDLTGNTAEALKRYDSLAARYLADGLIQKAALAQINGARAARKARQAAEARRRLEAARITVGKLDTKSSAPVLFTLAEASLCLLEGKRAEALRLARQVQEQDRSKGLRTYFARGIRAEVGRDLALVDALLREQHHHAEAETTMQLHKLRLLAQLGRQAAALAYGREVIPLFVARQHRHEETEAREIVRDLEKGDTK
jgi:hypothetical protein